MNTLKSLVAQRRSSASSTLAATSGGLGMAQPILPSELIEGIIYVGGKDYVKQCAPYEGFRPPSPETSLV